MVARHNMLSGSWSALRLWMKERRDRGQDIETNAPNNSRRPETDVSTTTNSSPAALNTAAAASPIANTTANSTRIVQGYTVVGLPITNTEVRSTRTINPSPVPAADQNTDTLWPFGLAFWNLTSHENLVARADAIDVFNAEITGPSPFFTMLPREIRDQIYQELIEHEPTRRIGFSYRNCVPTLHGVRYDRSLKSKLNRQFQEEFLQCVAGDSRAVIGINFVEEVVGSNWAKFSPADEEWYGRDYAPSIPLALGFLRSLQNVRDITVEVVMYIDPVHGNNYSIHWLNRQIQPLALLPANNTASNNIENSTTIKVKLPLYDSTAPLKGNRLVDRPHFFAIPGGPEAPWWLHHGHDWDEADLEGQERSVAQRNLGNPP
ncbi:hypothetical protein EG328_004758 [Venturia inaequalis]|uniref:Uncharacterized protein n=1 Tax=Venturia inaequalis TaxID=5025 RepID=A0A8H3ZBY3_VENIN|nr:hypothetical protein EG328_004758 [Venturia inaequalis]